ncbi:inositol monophosphatase [Patescibacteria group bacterium]|nr:inositol monophosphatase [Patescibacteria group bacterium]MBU1673069.1 inositol monophosphatase [Patescibacteria group bacterium]MBU1963675.1 inositol monophosphatase [Patescibacteria group bacterium]
MNKTEFLEDTIRKAGRSLKKNFGKTLSQKTKSGKGDFVTEADLQSEKIIINAIEKNFPEANILAEEAGELRQDSDYTWIIDPLDGTRNFVNGIPIFGVTIALARKKEIILGSIYIPVHDKFYLAQKGKGAYLNGERIHVSSENELEDAALGIDSVRSRTDNDFYAQVRRKFSEYSSWLYNINSAVNDLVLVASGKSDACVVAGAWPWDIAAGGLILQEAGGKITNIQGKRWQPFNPLQEVLVSNGKIHNKLLKILR